MTQEKLDLLKFSSVRVAKLGASATQIVRSNVLKAQTLFAFAHNVPDNVLRDTSTPARALSAHRAEDSAVLQFGSG
jgi:hypothetical protein